MSNDKSEWFAGQDEEDWTFAEGPYDTADEAISAGPADLDLEPGQSFYVGRKEAVRTTIDGASIIERAYDDAHEQVGKHAEEWFSPMPSREQIQDLTDHLTAVWEAWLKETDNEPTFYTVEDVTTHVVEGASDARAG